MSDPLDSHDAPAAPVAPEFQLTEDKNQIKHGDATYVRAEALHQAREEARNLKAEFAKLEPVLPDFEEFIRGKQSRQAATRNVVAPQSDDSYSDEELDGVASLRGYYTDQNTLDRTRARQDLDLMTRVSDRRAAKQVDPLRNSSAVDRAARNRQEATGRTFVDGQPIAEGKYIEQAFAALPAELAADPNIANLVQVIAVGLQNLEERKNGTGRHAPRRESVFSEGSRGRYNGDEGNLSQFDRAAARSRGKTDDQWSKMAAEKPARGREQSDGSFILEDY